MPTPDPTSLKLSEFCERIDVDEREVRYALARGLVPAGMPQSPGRGHHREFDARQAFWLAVVLRLKAAGLQTPLAGEVASVAGDQVRGAAQNLGWDWKFSPFAGQLQTTHTWLLEIGDGEVVRVSTDANPSSRDRLTSLPWVNVSTRKNVPTADPLVIIRVDLARLGRRLAGTN